MARLKGSSKRALKEAEGKLEESSKECLKQAQRKLEAKRDESLQGAWRKLGDRSKLAERTRKESSKEAWGECQVSWNAATTPSPLKSPYHPQGGHIGIGFHRRNCGLGFPAHSRKHAAGWGSGCKCVRIRGLTIWIPIEKGPNRQKIIHVYY